MSELDYRAEVPLKDSRAETMILLEKTQAKLKAARRRLLETDLTLDAIKASDSWRMTAPLRHLEGRWKRQVRLLLLCADKLPVWTLTGQLPRRIRAWRRSRASDAAMTAEAARKASFPPPSAQPPPPAPPKSGGKTILIADDSVPRPDRAAGARCTMAVIEALLAEGWSVTFWPHNRTGGDHYTGTLEALGVLVLDHRFCRDIEPYLDQYGAQFDHIMLMRPYVAAGLLPSVLRGSCAPILSYFGHDLHFARCGLEALQKNDPDLTYWAERIQAVERAIWRVVDLVLYLSEDEARVVREMEPGVEARAVTPYAYPSFSRRAAPTCGELLLFVGGLRHSPNEDAVLWFAKMILPRVLVTRPGARLVIAGPEPTRAVRALSGPAIEVTGQITDERLATLYDDARVALAPLRYGAGVKGKVVEAMRFGVPIVMTQIGAQGLLGLPASIPVHDDPTKFADAVSALLADDAGWMRQSADQVEYAERHFSLRAMQKSLLAALTEQGHDVFDDGQRG